MARRNIQDSLLDKVILACHFESMTCYFCKPVPFLTEYSIYSAKNYGAFETQRQRVRKFPAKDSRESENCYISEMQTIKMIIREIL